MSWLLVVDVGNTATKVGRWEAGGLAATRAGRTDDLSDPGAVAQLVADLPAGGGEKPVGMAVCSVVEKATEPWLKWAAGEGLEVLVIGGLSPAPLSNRYRCPEHLGADRLAAAVGAVLRMGAPVVVASLGTATVVDVVSRDREFLGGAVAAGVASGLWALAERTAGLPRVEPRSGVGPIGRETEECLQAGAVVGTAAMIEGLVERMRAQVGEEAGLALTGGYAGLVSVHLRLAHSLLPDLVLEGTAAIWEHGHGGNGCGSATW